MKKLPDKLSDLIVLALHDLALCAKDKRYKIDMNRFHSIDGHSGICSICLAGAVMVKSLDVPIHKFIGSMEIIEKNFKSKDEQKIWALDSIRRGQLHDKQGTYNWYTNQEMEQLDSLSKHEINEWQNHVLDMIGRLQSEGR